MQANFKGLVLGGHDPTQMVTVIVTNPDNTINDVPATIAADGSFTVTYVMPTDGNYSAYSKVPPVNQYSGGSSPIITFSGTTPMIVQTLTLSVEVTN